jgi:hypothetical protein
LPLVHVPPVGALDNAVVKPTQALGTPVMAEGIVFTVTMAVAAQPIPDVYEMVVVPGTSAFTTPDVVIVATTVLLLLHTPPGTASARVPVLPAHREVVPVIAAGNPFTVTTVVAAQPVTGM